MDYGEFFFREIEGLRQEGRYRVFAGLERQAGAFPRATRHAADSRQQVTVWCSNDYVGMGRHTPGRRTVIRDVAINVCGLTANWNPLSRSNYSTDNEFTKPVARFPDRLIL